MEICDPLVSVVIPAYNCGKFIDEVLVSVLSQTYENLEIIIIDDGSTDDTAEKIRKYGEYLTYIYQRNEGPSSSRNMGIRVSTGKYVAFLDSDDIWRPWKIERQVEFMERNPQLGFSFTDAAYFDESGEFVTSFLEDRTVFRQIPGLTNTKKEKVFAHKVWKELFLENFIVTSTMMIQRRCFDSVGFFDKEFSNAEDFDLWFRLARKYAAGTINETLTLKRYHQANISSIDGKVLDSWLRVRKKIVNYFPEVSHVLKEDVSRIMRNGYFHLGYWYFTHGRRVEARHSFLNSLRYKFDVRTLCFIGSTYLNSSLIDAMRNLKRTFIHEQAA